MNPAQIFDILFIPSFLFIMGIALLVVRIDRIKELKEKEKDNDIQ